MKETPPEPIKGVGLETKDIKILPLCHGGTYGRDSMDSDPNPFSKRLPSPTPKDPGSPPSESLSSHLSGPQRVRTDRGSRSEKGSITVVTDPSSTVLPFQPPPSSSSLQTNTRTEEGRWGGLWVVRDRPSTITKWSKFGIKVNISPLPGDLSGPVKDHSGLWEGLWITPPPFVSRTRVS